MKHRTNRIALLLLVVLILLLSSCGTHEEEVPQAVRELMCTQPTVVPGMESIGKGRIALCQIDYETEITMVQIVELRDDSVENEVTIEGVWELHKQEFSDGRLAFCNRATCTWKFLDDSLTEIGTWSTEEMNGFFSYDAERYYYLCDHVLCCQELSSGKSSRVELDRDLRFLEISAYDSENARMAVQFFLSPYSSECGTAVLNAETGEFMMISSERYQTLFAGGTVYLLSFDTEAMGYEAVYSCADGRFRYAKAGSFMQESNELYGMAGPYYLVGAEENTILYTAGEEIRSCSLSACGVPDGMYTACFLPEEKLLAGAVYQEGSFHLYVIDPVRLPFVKTAEPVDVSSPFRMDDSLVQNYWTENDGGNVAESLQEARQYADHLELRYGVRILLSDQCAETAALCDRPIILTDTMSEEDELECVNMALKALSRSLSLYPDGFFIQFQNRMGEGGICFLLVEEIVSDYGVVGCAYENGEENHILSRDYAAFLQEDWEALNPDGFTYYENAAMTESDAPWTLYSGSLEDVYFVDSYACVNAHEDRARIMEYFMTHEDEARLLIESPLIRQKLQWMCEAVRRNFDTSAWEEVRWEALL